VALADLVDDADHAVLPNGKFVSGLFRLILVPVDGSEPSAGAVASAARIAVACDAELLFCSIVDRNKLVAEAAQMPFADPTPAIDAVTEGGKRILGEALHAAADAHAKARAELCEGEPVAAILRLADEQGVDLIVMGSHGRGGIGRLLVGSTTEGVLRRSNVPVLVLREGVTLKPADGPAEA
jgi:nucleotide-binding universal stress UspA family protein